MNTPPHFTRTTLELQSTEHLLTLLPEGWMIFKDSGTWKIGLFDSDDRDFHHPAASNYNIREYLIEFLLQHPFSGDEIEITRWALT